MASTDRELEVFLELRRVLHGDRGDVTEAFCFRDPVADAQAAALAAWLRTLPAAIGWDALEARVRAEFGEPPDPPPG